MNLRRRPYALEQGPPAMQWDDYAALVSRLWRDLLDDPDVTEPRIQTFLEQNPALVPGAFGVSGPANHGPFIGALISQPRLPGLTRPVPDFMWIPKQSDRIFIVLIEIEDPRKKWFTRKGSPTAHLSQAISQIAEWKAWFAEPGNVVQFQNLYWLPQNWWRKVPASVQYVLIYGRAAEFEGRDDLLKRRSGLEPADTTIMTFDRLGLMGPSKSVPCAQVRGDRLVAKWFPPTFSIRPLAVENGIARLDGKEDAVDASPHIPSERKAFLKRRFRYWDEWAKDHPRGFFPIQDAE